MSFFNIVAATNEDTVVAAYEPSKVRSDSYQSEAELEKEFIRLLCEQGYTYLPLHTEDELIANLRSQLEELNHYQFSDTEWRQFFSDVIANPNEHIPEKTRKIQEDNVQVLHRDDGSSKNITLIDKKNIHNNRLQVINQYEVKQADGARHDNRYDVTILVNGFPLVHVELKRRGVAIREAFNQINRYQRDSFWAGCGLYEYVQIFVISNGTNTKYYSNSTRYNAIKDAKHGKTKKEKTSNSFEFTSYWADANNRVLTDLIDFTRTFFAKHTILSVLARYCIFTSEKMLMVMRPYQITATERILNRIEIANNYKKYGSIEGGGYIWHTTGSGKTLTSFKTARLASQNGFDEDRRPQPAGHLQIGGSAALTAVMLALTAFAVSNLGFLPGSEINMSIFSIRTLVDFSGVLILSVQHEQLQENALHSELAAMDEVLHRQYEQYKRSKEGINLINRRYHELKVQLARIREEQDQTKQNAAIAAMEQNIRQYEAENKTGNPVLDTLLTAKTMECQQENITITSVADGRMLGFLTIRELCTIVGVALDNAIAAVRAEPDPEKRLIKVAVYSQGGFAMLRFEHYTEAAPALDADGLPKQGSDLKSVRTTVGQHGGSMTMHWENNWCTLRILFPLPKNK